MPRDVLSAENQRVLAEYILEGLVDDEFIPQGETDREKRSSIESRAYTAWLRKHADECGNRGPETCRSMFQKRHDPYWTPPPLQIPEIAFPAPAKPVGAFVPVAQALPRGDAWEAEELFPEPAEDVPPPAEFA